MIYTAAYSAQVQTPADVAAQSSVQTPAPAPATLQSARAQNPEPELKQKAEHEAPAQAMEAAAAEQNEGPVVEDMSMRVEDMLAVRNKLKESMDALKARNFAQAVALHKEIFALDTTNMQVCTLPSISYAHAFHRCTAVGCRTPAILMAIATRQLSHDAGALPAGASGCDGRQAQGGAGVRPPSHPAPLCCHLCICPPLEFQQCRVL